MNIKPPILKSNLHSPPSTYTFNTSATNCQWLIFDSNPPSYLPIPPIPSAAQRRLAQKRAKVNATSNAAHRISVPALASSTGERCTWAGVGSLGQFAERDNSPAQDIPVEPWFSHPLFRPLRQPFFPPSPPRWRCLPRLTISRCGRQLGEHGQHAAPPQVPESVVRGGEQQ